MKLKGNVDGVWVTEDKLCLFLEQQVINRESRASGYQARKTARREMWKGAVRENKRQKTSESTEEWKGKSGGGEEEWDEEALDTLFHETVRYSVVNSYVSAITELHAWQSEGKPRSPLRGPKLSALLGNIRRDEDRIRRVNFVDRGLFTITGGYDIKGLRRAVAWCWEAASKTPGSVESYLRTSADHLLGLWPFHYIINIYLVIFPGCFCLTPLQAIQQSHGANQDVELSLLTLCLLNWRMKGLDLTNQHRA